MPKEELFAFTINGLPDDTFSVISFKGTEGLSCLYEFSIELVSNRVDIDLDETQSGLATLIIKRNAHYRRVQGIVSRLDQIRSVDGYIFYQATLTSRIWWLTISRRNQIFLDMTTTEIIAATMENSGSMNINDFEMRLTKSYPKREYVCQYDESHYNFISRWMEYDGMYYFFEQTKNGEKLIITDNAIAHALPPEQPALQYKYDKGLDADHRLEACVDFIFEQVLLPKKVRVKDYNYRTPWLDLMAETDIEKNGVGEVYIYGDNFKTSEEARQQSIIRKEEFLCKKHRYKGKSNACFLSAGTLFSLQGYFRHTPGNRYLPIFIKHEGNQTGYLLSRLGRCLSDRQAKDYYANAFVAIPANVQYRHQRSTPRPHFYGTMTAFIDAEGSGQYAEMDSLGRYKVRLPFDLSGRSGGHASSWIRKAEPYGGTNHGMHFPLHKGTEVLLTFVGGDVDRPIISAAVPNFEQRSVVKDNNFPANAIRTAGGNQLIMGDKEGQEFIGLYSPFHKSGIAIGSHVPGGGGSLLFSSAGDLESLALGSRDTVTIGATNEISIGNHTATTIGLKSDVTGAIGFSCDLGSRVEYNRGPRVRFGETSTDISEEITNTALDGITLSGGVRADAAALVNDARKAIGLGLSGVLASSGGTVALAQPWGEDQMSQGVLEHPNVAFGVGGALAALGVGGAVYGCYKTKTIVETFQETSQQCASQLQLDKYGAKVSVDSSVNADSCFVAEVCASGRNSGGNDKSSITISSKGNDIYINNKDEASIMMSSGVTTIKSNSIILKGKNNAIDMQKDNIVFRFKELNAGKLLKINANTDAVEIG